MRKVFILIALCLTALLTGCAAPSVVSNVTVFHSLNGIQNNKTYMVEATPDQANNLEFNSYVTILNQELLRHGFVMVNKDPGLKVSLKYGTPQTVASTQEPVPFYGPYEYGYGAYPAWQTSVDTYYMQQMEVSMNQVADGKNVYTVRTRLLSASPELSLSMDYLMESAFQNFPGKNGVTETVTVPVHQQ